MRKLLAILLLSVSALAVLFLPTPAIAATSHTVTLNWNTDAGATSFNVYRGTTAGGEGTVPYATGINGTSFTDSTVTGGTTYFYYVTAVGVGGESAPSSEVSAQVPVPPAPPTGLTITVH